MDGYVAHLSEWEYMQGISPLMGIRSQLNALTIEGCSGLPFESRCFGHYWYIHFLVPSKTSWNSASEGPKIIWKGQIKDQIKGQESSLLWLTQNNWFHKKVVEAFQRMSVFSTREWMFCAKQLLFVERICDGS